MERYRNNTGHPGPSVVRNRPAPAHSSTPPVLTPRATVEAITGECFPVAMAYVPWQYWGKLYPLDKALQRGTLFSELDKPFVGRGSCK